MKIKKIKQPQLKNKGFSLIELTVTLAVFGVIVLITTQIIEQVNVKKNINVQKEHITAYENAVIKKINANYDDIYLLASKASNQQLVYTYANFNDYAKNGGNDIESNISHSFFNPCVLIKADTARNTLSATLIYPANKTSIKNAAALSHELGNASWESSNKDLIGKVKTDYFTAQNIQALASLCNSKINSFESGSLFIDLNNNNNLISKKSNITDNSINKGSNETLKNNNDGNSLNKTLGTNLYMDAIVKEATPWATQTCDTSLLNPNEAITTCQASATGSKAYVSGADWGSSYTVLNNNKCQYQPTAFYKYTSYSCNSGDWSSTANTTCNNDQTAYYNKYGLKWYGGFSWDSTSLTGTSCKSRLGCAYDTNVCNVNLQPVYDDLCNKAHAVGCNCSGLDNPNYISISYVSSTNQCNLQSSTWSCNDKPFSGSAVVGSNGYNPNTISYYYRSFNNLTANRSETAPQRENCNTVIKDKFQQSGITPAQHKYKGLDLGAGVVVKSGSVDGVSNESDVYLNVKTAGVKSGYVIIKSKYMKADTQCKATELGKILQQADENGNYTTSQLICSYDVDFCGGTGYCYSPLVSQTQFIINGNPTNPTPTTLLSCPAGLRADSSWLPSTANGGLVDNGNCFAISQPLGIKIFGVITPIQVNDGSKAIGYKSVCRLQGADNNINALTKIKCTSASSLKTTTCERDANDQLQCQ